jgi:NAD(P)-dependent dehydrogenase (short-subunit alcohol dehydrogenase family)
VLVSNAYTVEVAPADATSRASWDRQLAVSLTGTFLGVRALPRRPARDRRQRRRRLLGARAGRPARPSRVRGGQGRPGRAGPQLAVEYGPALRVNTVLPGPILTAAWDRVSEGTGPQRRRDRRRPLRHPGRGGRRGGLPGLAEAAYVTGASLVVDGGWTA